MSIWNPQFSWPSSRFPALLDIKSLGHCLVIAALKINFSTHTPSSPCTPPSTETRILTHSPAGLTASAQPACADGQHLAMCQYQQRPYRWHQPHVRHYVTLTYSIKHVGRKHQVLFRKTRRNRSGRKVRKVVQVTWLAKGRAGVQFELTWLQMNRTSATPPSPQHKSERIAFPPVEDIYEVKSYKWHDFKYECWGCI